MRISGVRADSAPAPLPSAVTPIMGYVNGTDLKARTAFTPQRLSSASRTPVA
jgi:hypothetical protein